MAIPSRPSIPGGVTEVRRAARLAPHLPSPLGGGVLLLVLGAVPKATGRGVRDLVLGGWGSCSLSLMRTLSPLPPLPESTSRALEGRAGGGDTEVDGNG